MAEAVHRHTEMPKPHRQWEWALGLENTSGLERLARVREGLPVAAFYRFAETSGVGQEQLAAAAGISVRTVQRRRGSGGRLDAGPSERLVRLADLYTRAAEVTGGDLLARQWMQTPRDAFGGRTPFELAGSELGAGEVEDLLLRIEHGTFY